MKKSKGALIIKAGSADQFMEHVKKIMCAADKGKVIKPSHTFTFESQIEMLNFYKKRTNKT